MFFWSDHVFLKFVGIDSFKSLVKKFFSSSASDLGFLFWASFCIIVSVSKLVISWLRFQASYFSSSRMFMFNTFTKNVSVSSRLLNLLAYSFSVLSFRYYFIWLVGSQYPLVGSGEPQITSVWGASIVLSLLSAGFRHIVLDFVIELGVPIGIPCVQTMCPWPIC